MAQRKPKSSEASGALKEGQDVDRNITVRGIEFELPDPPPFAVVLAIRSVVYAESQLEQNLARLGLAEAYVGEQINPLYEQATSAEDGYKAVDELLEAIDAHYGTESGGILGLAQFLTERWGLIEADFQRVYRLDFRHEVNHTPIRRLAALIHGLPADSATWEPQQEEEPEPETASMAERIAAFLGGSKRG